MLVLVWRVDELSAGHVGGTCGSGIVSGAVDMLWMSVGTGERWTCLYFGCGGVEWVGVLDQGPEC